MTIDNKDRSVVGNYRLSHPTPPYDSTTTAVREDLADIALAGRFSAPYYALAVARVCAVAEAPLYAQAKRDSARVATLAQGDSFALLDIEGAWGWGYRHKDNKVGYCLLDTLRKPSTEEANRLADRLADRLSDSTDSPTQTPQSPSPTES